MDFSQRSQMLLMASYSLDICSRAGIQMQYTLMLMAVIPEAEKVAPVFPS